MMVKESGLHGRCAASPEQLCATHPEPLQHGPMTALLLLLLLYR